jgi:two-component system, cell cycle sensor histidine kinase and response regulator CckA
VSPTASAAERPGADPAPGAPARSNALLRYPVPTPPGDDEALTRVCRLATTLLDATAAAVWLTQPAATVLAAAVGLPDTDPAGEVPASDDFCGEVLRSGGSVVVSDAGGDPRFAALPLAARHGLAARLAAPLRMADGRVVGVLTLHDAGPRAWTPREAAALDDLAATVVAELHWREQRAQRERVELALRDSEERFRLMVEGSEQVFFYVHDQEHVFEYLSPSVEDVVGYPPEQLLGNPYDVLLTGDTSDDEVHAITDGAIDAGQGTAVYVARTRHRDGRIVTLELVESPIVHEGAVVGIQGFARDISDRVRNEQEMRRQALLFEMMLDAVLVIDPAGRIVDLNPAAETLYGRPRAELIGRAPAVLQPADSVPALEAGLRAAVGQAGRWHGEVAVERPDGTRMVVDTVIVAQLDAYARQIAYVSIGRDITARKRAEEAMRETNRSLRALIDAFPLAVVTLDADSRVTGWNPAAERLLGWAEAEVLGRPYPLVLPEQEAEHRAMLRAALDGQSFDGREVRRQRRDGRPVDLAFWSARLHESEHDAEHVVGVYIDITERKQLEEQLRQSQKMEAVGRLAGGIAHDFNNLLTAVKGNAEMLLFDELAPATAAGLEEIRRAAIRAAGLTRQLLAFSRKQVLQPEVLDLNGAIREMHSMLRRLIGEDIELSATLDPALGAIRADPGQVEQVILNLVVNARDAMPTGGVLEFDTRNVELSAHAAARLGGLAPGRYARLTVTDTGHGMDPATRLRVFEPFFTTKEQGKGTGLGLSTVFGIVQQSGGHVGVQSEPGRGSVFHVYLPCVDESPTPEAVVAPPQAVRAGAGAGTVLLVEDEPAVRTLAEKVLRRQGYHVLSAADGEAALRLVDAHPDAIDLLLTDVVMPGLSGPAVAERLLALRPHTPVVFMSGYAGDTILHHGLADTGHAFIEKPFTVDGLARAVAAALRRA